MRRTKSGFSSIEVILVIAVILLAGGLVYVYLSRPKDDVAKTDSTSQVAQESPANETPNTAQATEQDKNKGYLVASDWGVRFKIPSGIRSAEYTIAGDTLAIYALPSASEASYITNYKDRDPQTGNPLHSVGVLIRSTQPTIDLQGEPVAGKKVGAHYFYTYGGFSNISTGMACSGIYGSSDNNCQTELDVLKLTLMNSDSLLASIEPAL